MKRRPNGLAVKDARARALFDEAVRLLRALPASYSIYVANTTMCLMLGPSHDESFRPLHKNMVASAGRVRISGGDW